MVSTLSLIIEAAGCVNRCKHCYAAGAPYDPMDLDQYSQIVTSFNQAATRLGLQFDAYPMHDVTTHPQVGKVIEVTLANSVTGLKAIQPFVTPGDSLAMRPDSDTVVQQLRQMGMTDYWLTLHGRGEDHDWATSRRGSYDLTLETIAKLHSLGCTAGANYYITRGNARYAPDHIAELRHRGLSRVDCCLAIENFPSAHRDRYFDELPTLEDVLPVHETLARESAFAQAAWSNPESMTERHYLSKVRHYEAESVQALTRRAASLPLSLVCRRDLSVHIGEAGTYFDLLGKALETPPEAIIEKALQKGVTCLEKYYFEQNSDVSIEELSRKYGDQTSTKLHWTYEGLRLHWLALHLQEKGRITNR